MFVPNSYSLHYSFQVAKKGEDENDEEQGEGEKEEDAIKNRKNEKKYQRPPEDPLGAIHKVRTQKSQDF